MRNSYPYRLRAHLALCLCLAQAHGRKRVTCMVKDNIMKITDGMFRRVFEKVAAEYPDRTRFTNRRHWCCVWPPRRYLRRGFSPNLYGEL